MSAMICSYLSPKCEARNESRIHRYGVFAKEAIEKSELIAVWGGYIVTTDELATLTKEILEDDYSVQVYPGIYLSPKSRDDLSDGDMVNHSCDPKAGIKGQNILVARRAIQAGEEVCFDYETTDTQGLNFVCRCNTPKCRGVIDGQAWKNKQFQRENREYLSWYIQNAILDQQKRARVHGVRRPVLSK